MGTHLTEQELDQYVDALVLERHDQLQEEIREHVAECKKCKTDIVETLDIIWAAKQSQFSSQK